MAETEARDKEITVADTEETFAEKYISRENGIGSLSDEEVIECFEAIPAYDFFSRCRSKHKSEEYAYKQELAPRYYQIMREEGRRIGEEYGVLEDLPYIYGELPDIDEGPELDEWIRRQVAAYEHYELVKSMGVDLTWTEEYYQYAKGREGLEALKKETQDDWAGNSEDSVFYKVAGAIPGTVYSFGCYVAGKPIDVDSAWYYPSQMTQTIRGTVEDGMGNGFTGEVKKIVYRSGMGMADFAAAQVITNSHGEILLGMEGYADTAMTGAGRGLSPFAIQGEAAIAGFGDMLMGKVFKKAGSETLTKGMVHAVETGTISSLMNTGADCILAGDKSSIREEYQGCLDAGMSSGEAVVRVGLLEGGKLLENAAQGVISTAGFHGIGKVTTMLGTHMGIIDGPSHVDANAEDSRNYGTDSEYEETDFETNDRNIYDEETAEMYERIYDQQRENNPEYEEFILELRELTEVQDTIYDEYMDPLRVADADGTIMNRGELLADSLTSQSVKKVIKNNGYTICDFIELLAYEKKLSVEEAGLVQKIRNEIGLPQEGTVMNKTIPQADIYKYLFGEYSGVRGFVSVDEHSNLLNGFAQIYEGNRLDYDNTAFKIGYGVDGVSDRTGNPDTVYGKITYILEDANSVRICPDQPTDDNIPYTGKGFTSSKNIVLPEQIQDSRPFIDGDILGIYDATTGNLTYKFIFDTNLGWLPQ